MLAALLVFMGGSITVSAAPADEVGQAAEYEALINSIPAEMLNDSVITFEEIPALVEKYSQAARAQELTYQSSTAGVPEVILAYRDEYFELYDSYQDQMDELDDLISDTEDAAGKAALREEKSRIRSEREKDTRLQELRKLLKNYERLIENADTVRGRTTTQKKRTMQSAEKAMLSYQEQVLAVKKAEQETAYYQSAADKARIQAAAGSQTALRQSQAELNLRSAENRLRKEQDTLDSLKREIALSLGWTADTYGSVSIGEVPAVPAGYLSTRDREADLVTIKEHSQSYSSAVRAYDQNWNPYQVTQENVMLAYTEQQLQITMDRLRDAITAAEQTMQVSETSRALAQKKKESADVRRAAGTIDDSEYDQLSLDAIGKQNDYELAVLRYHAAVLNYEWALKGLSA